VHFVTNNSSVFFCFFFHVRLFLDRLKFSDYLDAVAIACYSGLHTYSAYSTLNMRKLYQKTHIDIDRVSVCNVCHCVYINVYIMSINTITVEIVILYIKVIDTACLHD